MQPRTAVALVVILASLGGAIAFAMGGNSSSNVQLTERWVSDTAREIYGNHHAPAARRIQGQPMVYAPISGRGNTGQCALVALNGDTGNARWRYGIPAANCTLHSVADPTLADYDGDGVTEVLAATTEQTVAAYHPLTGEKEFEYNLSSYGYTKPLVTDFTGDGSKEIIVTDVRGTVFVIRPNGTTVWSKQLSTYTWGQPAVADFDGDSKPELAVALGGNGSVYMFEQNGSVTWNRTALFESATTWMTTGQADGDSGIEVVAATDKGKVAMLDGATGSIQWQQDLGQFAAVHAFGDGDSDGKPEVYAVAQDGKLRSRDATDGSVEWTTTLTSSDVQMMPPPSMGDVDGDGEPELVAVTNDGVVSIVDPTSGAVRASYERDVPIYTQPTLADTDNDGVPEIFVIYGDGRVVSFSATR